MDCLAPLRADSHTAPATEARVLSFSAGGPDFAIDIRCVREIRTAEPATRIPGGPALLRGAIDRRGTIAPVIDLARRVGAANALGAGALRPVPPLADTPLTAHLVTPAVVGERLLQWLDVSSLLQGAPVSAPVPAPIPAPATH